MRRILENHRLQYFGWGLLSSVNKVDLEGILIAASVFAHMSILLEPV